MLRRSFGIALLATSLTVLLVAGTAVASPGKPTKQRHSVDARSQAGVSPAVNLPPGYKEVFTYFHYDAGAQTFAEVACPAGTVVYGGGFEGLGPSVNSTYPDGDTAWAVFVDSIDRSGDVDVYAICANRTAKWSIQEISFSNPSGQQTHQEVPCPKGTEVLGGGAWGSDADVGAQSINSTYPRQARNRYYWDIKMNNADSTDQSAIAIAICGSAAGYFIKHIQRPNHAGETSSFTQTCGPRGTLQVPLDGGVSSSSRSTSVYFVVSALVTRRGFPYSWWTGEANGSSERATATEWVICVGT